MSEEKQNDAESEAAHAEARREDAREAERHIHGSEEPEESDNA